MEAACPFEKLVPAYKPKWSHNPEDHHGHLHSRVNLKYQTVNCLIVN
jgi:hypothetical protein